MNLEIRKQFKGPFSIMDNAYRTKNYLVSQHIEIKHDKEEHTVLCSYDTFYKRNPKRDANYEKFFKNRLNLDGKRVRVAMSTRTYIE